MREKMIAIAGRLRARAAEPRDCNKPLGMTPEDILNCIAEEIEEELKAPQPAVADDLCPSCGKPRGYSEICINKHHSMSSIAELKPTPIKVKETTE